MAFNAGDVVTRLRFDQDTRGADAYERRLQKVRGESRRDIVTHAKVDADTRGAQDYERRLRDVDRAHGDVVRGSTRVRAGLGSIFVGGAGGAVAAAGFYALEKGVRGAFGAYKESERVSNQTNAVLKSTGHEAGVSAKHVTELATALSKKTGIDDEAIQSGENLLLTFTNVRNEAGKGNDVFDRATGLLTDMSAALGQDTKSSAIQLGKALNDPVKGVTALQRVGVSFTKSQKEQIKGLVEHGKSLDAQKIILRELGKEFGGSAAATATSSKRLGVSFGNVAESVGRLLSPAMEKASGGLTKFLDGMNEGRGAGGRFVTAMRNAGGVVRGVFGGAIRVGQRILEGIGDVIRDRHKQIGEFGGIVRQISDRVRRAVGQIGQAFSNVFDARSGIGKDLRNIGERLVDFGLIVAKVVNAITKRSIPGIVTVFRGLATILRGIIRVISGILSGDFGKAWDGVKDIFRGAIKVVGGLLRAATAPFRAAAAAIGRAISGPLDRAWQGILGKAEGFINTLIDIVNAPLKILGLKTIGHVHLARGNSGGGAGGGGPSSRGASGPAVAQRAMGGRVDAPIVLMGEEAPTYPEWVIPVNPAYRNRAIGLWMKAARDLGIPGFAQGGQLSFDTVKKLWRDQGGNAAAANTMAWISDAESGRNPLVNYGGHVGRIPGGGTSIAAGLYQILGLPFPGDVYDPATNTRMAISKSSNGRNLGPWVSSRDKWGPHVGQQTPAGGGVLGAIGRAVSGAVGAVIPDIHWPHVPDLGPFTGIPRAAMNRIKDYIGDKIKSFVGVGGGAGGPGAPGGPAGTEVFKGVTMAKWVAAALRYAQTKGVESQPTSGYRPGFDPHTASGKSEHQGLQYPHGAVDFGSFTTGLGPKMAVVRATADFKWPLLAPIGFRDDGHASGTGHRMGGLIPFEAFKKGGKRKAKKKHHAPAPRLSAKENRGITRSVARGERGISGFEDEIQRLERQYSQADTRFGLDDADFLIEHDDGSTTVDTAAVNDRLDELKQLREKRAAIKARIIAYRRAVLRLIRSIKAAVAKLAKALKAAKGKARQKERGGYRETIKDYNERLGELRGTYKDLGLDIEDQRIDLAELDKERAEVKGTTGAPAPPADAAAPADTGADAVAPADATPAPPTAEDIARGVAEEFASFQSARADQFAAFGSNFERTSRLVAGGLFPTGDTGRAGAGLRAFGAFGGSAGAAPAGGVTLEQHFAAPPPDPHIWSQQAVRELGGALA